MAEWPKAAEAHRAAGAWACGPGRPGPMTSPAAARGTPAHSGGHGRPSSCYRAAVCPDAAVPAKAKAAMLPSKAARRLPAPRMVGDALMMISPLVRV